jgi:hypothetical protein
MHGRALGLAVFAIAACSSPFRTTIALDRDELQSRIEPSFPIEQELSLLHVALEHPRVVLEEHRDRIGIDLDVRAGLGVFEKTGRIGVTGRLTYDPDVATVYLVDPEIAQLEIPGLDEERTGKVKEVIARALSTGLARIPIHTLEGPAEVKVRPLLRSVTVQGGRVLVELGV